jgi:hypothetical protein
MDLVFNDTISINPSQTTEVTLSTTLPSGVTGVFTGVVMLKTGWLKDGGHTIWMAPVTITAT